MQKYQAKLTFFKKKKNKTNKQTKTKFLRRFENLSLFSSFVFFPTKSFGTFLLQKHSSNLSWHCCLEMLGWTPIHSSAIRCRKLKILNAHSKVWDDFWHLTAFSKRWKVLFISPWKLFLFSRYLDFSLSFFGHVGKRLD